MSGVLPVENVAEGADEGSSPRERGFGVADAVLRDVEGFIPA